MTTQPRMRDHLHGQSGSMPLAMIAIIMIGGLVVALLSMVSTSQVVTRHDRDFQHSAHAAEVGIQEAVTDINHQDPSGTYPRYEDGGAELTGSDGDDEPFTWSYTARKTGFTTWEVKAHGTDGQVTRHMEAVVTRSTVFPEGAFGAERVELAGNNTVASYNSTTGEVDTGNGTVGSNGTITLAESSSADIVSLHGPSASCEGPGCDSATMTGSDEPIEYDVDLVTEGLATCPNEAYTWRASEQGGVIDNHPTSDQLCVTDLIFDVDTTVGASAPVKVYVTGEVRIGKHVEVNCVSCDKYKSPGELKAAGEPLPKPRDLQIYVQSKVVRVGNQSSIAAVIYAPQADCTGNPSSAHAVIYGSIVCNDMKTDGGWSFYFDDQLSTVSPRDYDVSSLREEVGGTTSFNW